MNTEQLMEALETSAKAAAIITGMKQQLLDQGWSQEASERIVIHWITNSGAA